MKNVPVKDFFIGPKQPLAVMSGPCVIESEDNALFAADHTASLISLVSTLRSTGYFKVRVRQAGDSAGRKYFQGSLSLAQFWY